MIRHHQNEKKNNEGKEGIKRGGKLRGKVSHVLPLIPDENNNKEKGCKCKGNVCDSVCMEGLDVT